MSLSRVMAQAVKANDEETLTKVLRDIAEDTMRGRASRRGFDSILRRHLHMLHAGGFSNEKLKEIRRVGRKIFHEVEEERKLHPVPPREVPPANMTKIWENYRG